MKGTGWANQEIYPEFCKKVTYWKPKESIYLSKCSGCGELFTLNPKVLYQWDMTCSSCHGIRERRLLENNDECICGDAAVISTLKLDSSGHKVKGCRRCWGFKS